MVLSLTIILGSLAVIVSIKMKLGILSSFQNFVFNLYYVVLYFQKKCNFFLIVFEIYSSYTLYYLFHIYIFRIHFNINLPSIRSSAKFV
jgi:hypothetical protein